MATPKKLKFTNRSSDKMKLILEPWAEEYSVETDMMVEVLSDQQSDKEIEVEYNEGDLIVYGWSDSMVVLHDGKKLEPQFD